MKKDKFASCLVGTVLGFCLAFGGAGGMVSGFSMERVSLPALALWCAAASLVFSLCFTFRLGALPPCILALAGGYLWQRGSLSLSVEGLLYYVSTFYDRGYGVGVIHWSGRNFAGADMTLALGAVAALTALTGSWTVCRRHRAFLAVPVALMPLIACLVVTDTLPEDRYLFLLLFAIVLLVLTQTTRRREEREGNILTGLLAVPSALAVGLLFLAAPREAYQGPPDVGQMWGQLENWVQDIPLEEIPGAELGLALDGVAETVNLENIGPQGRLNYRVMWVTAEQSGPLYLRGCAFDTYDGKTWTNAKNEAAPELLCSQATTIPLGDVTVTTRVAMPLIYVPYYPLREEWMADTGESRVENEEKLTSYVISRVGVERAWEIPVENWDGGDCLALPGKTRTEAEKILAEIFAGAPMDPKTAPDKIAAYVSSSARYDLQTERMPRQEDDFALWFLKDSSTGYCVHFATAAAVLLRAAGIPARYVTGYLTETRAEEAVMVRGENAHAWVEYYCDGVGWTVLEATPGGSGQDDGPIPTEGPGEETKDTGSWTEPTDQTMGEDGGKGSSGEKTVGDPLKNLLKAILWGFGSAAAAVVQWQLRLRYRRWKQARGNENIQALARWREAEGLARLLHRPQEPSLLELAQKAKYSQHRLTREELAAFDKYREDAVAQLKQKPWPARLVYRILFAAY